MSWGRPSQRAGPTASTLQPSSRSSSKPSISNAIVGAVAAAFSFVPGIRTEEDVASFVNGVVDREDLRMVVDHHRDPTDRFAAQVPIARDQ